MGYDTRGEMYMKISQARMSSGVVRYKTAVFRLKCGGFSNFFNNFEETQKSI